jgi:hypothetical protein
MIALTNIETECLKRVLDFVVMFHDDLPETSPELANDLVALLQRLGDAGHFEFAEQLLNHIAAPAELP